jgi:transposase-like protein
MWKLTKFGELSQRRKAIGQRRIRTSQRIGDAYCFVAMERNTKLVLTHYLGKRNAPSTEHFIAKLARATSHFPYQLTTDGFQPYIKAVKRHLAGRVHFGQLVKVYASPREGGNKDTARPK